MKTELFTINILNIIVAGSGSFHNAMRGYALKKLLIDGISTKIDKDFQIVQYYMKEDKKVWTFNVTAIDYFKTHRLKNNIKNFLRQVAESAHILYVPNSPNYRLIDCVLMKVEPVKTSKREEDDKIFEVMLYLLQSTINIETHEKGDLIICNDTSKTEYCGHEICSVFFFSWFNLIFVRSYNL